ncbi:MAG: hypothetical protein ND866_17900 [Pyrinomonadaceae bacterium]|nr:hypothetical protein [Pyrinomonadaceae bacterium]
MRTSLSTIVESLDSRILNDSRLGPDEFARLLTAQRVLGLLHDDRPTCPFLRPHILARTQYEAIETAAEIIAIAFDKLVARALEHQPLLDKLGLTPDEEKMARIDPGYSQLCITSRLDTYLTDSGFQFLEYNAENPAGVSDQMQLEKILLELPHMRDFLDQYEHWTPKPHLRLLNSLLATYREWGGQESSPQIAIVDWEGVSTASEFEVLKQYFESAGHRTTIVDPRALEYDGECLRAGTFRIDIVYKRVIIHEFLEKFDDTHPLLRAYRDRRVCMANSFRVKVAHKKAGFAILSDPRYEDLFTDVELNTLRRHIPWTRIVRKGTTSFDEGERELGEILRTERERLVLKPNDDYGGHGVVMGWECSPYEWEQRIAQAFAGDYVVQERVSVKKVAIPRFAAHIVRRDEMFVDFNPFLFQNQMEGGLVRLSASSLCNVSSGGGQTALLVLEND